MYVLTFTRSFNICSIKLLSECLTSFHIYIWHKLDCYAELLSSQIKIKEIKKNRDIEDQVLQQFIQAMTSFDLQLRSLQVKLAKNAFVSLEKSSLLLYFDHSFQINQRHPCLDQNKIKSQILPQHCTNDEVFYSRFLS